MAPEPDTLLVIDTATEACSVALFDRGALIASDHAVMGRGHAERLVPMIARLPGKGRAAAVLVNCGPGSFTGVRVGLAAARALGLAWNVPVSGYSTLSLVAAMALAEAADGAGVDVAMTGGHGEYFVQGFDARGVATGALASLTPDAAAAACTRMHVAGSMAQALVAARGFGTAQPLLPDARSALLLAPDARTLPADPVYGRGADAKPMAVQPSVPAVAPV
ncbi:tRNA (adenosine(37)-N6)-threonylcarbamoyltransferase complex dimerization subunit type 1 TsaB [Blastomonas fulva]|uniref:tRNA (adenosine(37)-N6)-threonylcarbamoyltransferase complex dimerization subunit type 1 TsaB n=1 Tax=Blastomonas fulva TaxID=1550728 RepID=UPI0025A3F4ED|nr:tRNA (adenosine(37)-N6)-threonylcarbamoyltransferase complex dimerization subunit type 1 TsaB [Blastomonas fulva]MDM7927798.1 tRNA (adenosine(37)-N6)-threonylcarbamoyltransferase complex dimerization subunit type 1 TsaB [Blastomonas fulva]MDM7967563.1 tRNA (adenosine(37)-N6)-threonylcarbamoyltransferase complex dimerization subunit type 1 TsaB [Blastomonas fulva]